jgi:hypothetical protein
MQVENRVTMKVVGVIYKEIQRWDSNSMSHSVTWRASGAVLETLKVVL